MLSDRWTDYLHTPFRSNERVSRVENQIIARLRDRLGTARNASEMFRVFSRFNTLFVRPKIRGAIQEYQTALIDSVKEDIADLHKTFRVSYKHSEAYRLAQLRDMSPIAGAIIWAKQIERQLNAYLKRVEDVLGKGWELYAEGARLASEGASFKRKLDTRPIYEAWLHEINRRDLQITGRIFDITRTRNASTLNGFVEDGLLVANGNADGNDDPAHQSNISYALSINFDPQIITLFKEVRNLLWAGFSVPHAIGNIAKDAKRVYPYAVSIMETVRMYSLTIDRVFAHPDVLPLVAEHRRDIQQLITKGMSLRWEFFVNAFDSRQAAAAVRPTGALSGNDLMAREGRHSTFVREFAAAVSIFQDRTDSLLNMHAAIDQAVDELGVCRYETAAFQESLSKIQAIVDKLNLEGYSNLETWVVDLDLRIEAVLHKRLEEVIDLWCEKLSRNADYQQDHEEHASMQQPAINGHAIKGTVPNNAALLRIAPVQHEMRIRNQLIYLDPPIEAARAHWYQQLQQWMGVVCNLQRVQSSRYEIGLKMRRPRAEESQYIGLLGRLSGPALKRPFAAIEDRVTELTDYVNKWLEFQSLWDLEADFVYERLGDSLNDWQQLLSEIRKTRQTFDTSESHHDLGVAVVHYEQVQAKVTAKYDSWQREILGRFGIKLGAAMRDSHTDIAKARHDLEHHAIETSTTAQAVALITFVQDLKKKVVMSVLRVFATCSSLFDDLGITDGHRRLRHTSLDNKRWSVNVINFRPTGSTLINFRWNGEHSTTF